MVTSLTHPAAALRDLSIRAKLAAMVSVPLVALAFVAGGALLDRHKEAGDAATIERLSVLAVSIGDFVHAAQKERGATALFLGSGGKEFGAELAEIRKAADVQRTRLTAEAGAVDRGSLSPALVRRIDATATVLPKIDAHRAAVDSLELDAPTALTFYTKMNAAALDAVAQVTNESDDATLSRQVLAYAAFLRAKDRPAWSARLSPRASRPGASPRARRSSRCCPRSRLRTPTCASSPTLLRLPPSRVTSAPSPVRRSRRPRRCATPRSSACSSRTSAASRRRTGSPP